tara:strand:- start:595 stop:1461 length:867 start_codon:yes stop_codon:yes gene_type:complete
MTDLLFAFDQQALIVKDVQESFLSFFHPLLFFLRHFDSIPYYLLFTASIVSLCPKKEGESALYLVLSCFYLNNLLKYRFDMPRPGAFIPDLDLSGIGHHYGFPSGGAMTSVIIGTLLARHIKHSSRWFIALCYVALVSLSRVYLGAHFPIDVAGGLLFGILLSGIFLLVERLMTSSALSLNRSRFFLVALILTVSLYGIHPGGATPLILLLMSGAAVGKLCFFENDRECQKALKLLVTIAGTLILFAGFKWSLKGGLINNACLFALGFWIAHGSHVLSSKIEGAFKSR